MCEIDFDYELPSGQGVLVTARIFTGLPMMQPSLDGPGEPEEEPFIDIFMVQFKHDDGGLSMFDPEDLYFKDKKGNFIHVIRDIEDHAWEEYEARK